MIKKLMNKPLMIEASALESISSFEWFSSENGAASYDLHDNIAIIPIYGLLTKRREMFDSLLGTTSYEEIHDLVSEALEDSSVNSILLDIDSPGGEVSGLFDLTDFIYESRDIKPIYAIANDCACSAAYAIASSASKLFATRTSSVGSIGVIATHVDISEYDKKEGVKYTTIFAGDKKNDLSSHDPITDAAASDLQAEVDRLYKMFVALVARNRNISSTQIKATQAGVFFGSDAIGVGLVDEICDLRKCLTIIKGGKNMTETTEETINIEQEREASKLKYKSEIMEIATLCKLAKSDKLAEFIEQNLTPDQVKEKLLALAAASQNEIVSTVYHQEKMLERPVISAAKLRSINI